MLFRSFDQKEIFVHEWLDVENPKGLVQIVHGMTEHGKRYEAFAKFLNEHGYYVVADDHRGHGNTDKDTLGYCKGDMFQDTVRDEGELTGYYRRKLDYEKHIVFGFSYGSFLTQSYIGQYGNLIDGAIIGGSSYKKDFEVRLGSFVSGISPKKKPAKLIENLSFGAYEKQFDDREWLSNDAENNAAYHADPFCGFTCSNRFYHDFFKGLKKLYTKKYIGSLNKELPLLLIAGKNDPVGEMGKGMEKLKAFYTQKAGMKNVTLTLFEGSRHEFLNEKENRDEKWQTVLSFLEGVEARV